MKVISKIFAPHSDIQSYLMQYLSGKGYHNVLWLPCGTKFGKTLAGAGSIAMASNKHRNSTLRIVAPIYRQTKISWKYVEQMLPGRPFVEPNKVDNIMRLPGYKNEIEFWSGKNPEDLEGGAVQATLLDEAAKLKEQVYISNKTTMTRTRGRTALVSTPRGRNFFHTGYKDALLEMERAKRENRVPKEIALSAPTLANPNIDMEAVADAKRTLSNDMFAQYYLAQFVDSGRVFPTPKINKEIWKEAYYQDGQEEFWIHPDAHKMRIVAGCDWAKKKDYTVLTVWDYSKRPFQCVGFLRMNGKRYTKQVIDIVKFLRKYNACDLLLHDQTGIGEVIEDLLSVVPGLHFRGVIFTNNSKSYLVNDLVAGMEREEIEFPWWEELQNEFETFEVDVSEIGNMKYAAETGKHDDIPFSCCLGYQACNEFAMEGGDIKFLEELGDSKMDRDTIDNYIAEILDIDLDEGF